MDVTECYCYFAIKGNFNPHDVTQQLSIQPTRSWAIGDFRRDGKSQYTFALWETGRKKIKIPDYEIKCIETIHGLIGKEKFLNEIKEQNDVSFVLEIVPSIYNGEKPVITIGKDVIKFCCMTETDIDIDMYVYPFSEAEE